MKDRLSELTLLCFMLEKSIASPVVEGSLMYFLTPIKQSSCLSIVSIEVLTYHVGIQYVFFFLMFLHCFQRFLLRLRLNFRFDWSFFGRISQIIVCRFTSYSSNCRSQYLFFKWGKGIVWTWHKMYIPQPSNSKIWTFVVFNYF